MYIVNLNFENDWPRLVKLIFNNLHSFFSFSRLFFLFLKNNQIVYSTNKRGNWDSEIGNKGARCTKKLRKVLSKTWYDLKLSCESLQQIKINYLLLLPTPPFLSRFLIVLFSKVSLIFRACLLYRRSMQ